MLQFGKQFRRKLSKSDTDLAPNLLQDWTEKLDGHEHHIVPECEEHDDLENAEGEQGKQRREVLRSEPASRKTATRN